MRPDVQLIVLLAVSNIFQVVMSNGILVGIGHEIGEGLCFPVEEVEAAPFGADPDIIVFIFCHVPDERKAETIFP